MSVRTMAKVWADSQHGGTELLMLLALADFSDDDGFCYPSVAKLAVKCRTTPRHANRLIAGLVTSGELEVRGGCGPTTQGGRLNLFRVRLEAIVSKKVVTEPSGVSGMTDMSGVTSKAERDDVHVPKGVTCTSAKPSLNHQEPPVGASPSISDQQKTVDQEKPVKKPVRKKVQQSFKTWYEAAKAENEKALPADDPIHAYAKSVGLDIHFLNLQFAWLKEKYLNDPKLQADWAAVFRNSVRNCWGKLWLRTSDGIWKLTTAGKQAALAHGFDENMTCGGRDPWAGCV